MPEGLTPNQKRTVRGREAFLSRFPTAEAKSEHFRALAVKANAGRLVLSGAEAESLAAAYRLIGEIVGRANPPAYHESQPDDRDTPDAAAA